MWKDYYYSDIIVSFFILLTGAAEAAHLAGVFLHRSLSDCTVLFGVLAALILAGLGAAAFFMRKRERKCSAGKEKWTKAEKGMLVVFGFLLLTQLLYAAAGKNIYCQGDMTVETVGSFIRNDGIYQVNPLTGGAYVWGIPSRLEILCLPTMYASLCSIFRMNPADFVWHVVPAAVILLCYAAYCCLGKSLFPKNRTGQLCFLIAAALLIDAGSYRYGMDGFGILFSGWRGVTLRNAVLIPYAVSLCLRKKYFHALLCVLAEACIVWTLYGLGACVIVVAGMAFCGFAAGRKKTGEEVER